MTNDQLWLAFIFGSALVTVFSMLGAYLAVTTREVQQQREQRPSVPRETGEGW